MNPTPEQKLAIYEDGKNIIVSAGAGSGKTAVLSERVLQKVLSGVSVDRLLILTFTKAAASEMKDRIRNKIKENKLIDQLNRIDNSYITTFDSFSLSIVKKYHYLLNIKKNVNIIESNVLKLITKKYLDEILEEKYLQREDNFVKLISDFCIKDDDELKKRIIKLHDKLNLRYDKKEYLENYLKNFYASECIEDKICRYEKLLREKIDEVDLFLKKIADLTDADYFSKVINNCQDLLNSQDYNHIRSSLLSLEIPKMPKGSGEIASNTKKQMMDVIKELKRLTEIEDREKLKESLFLMQPYLEALIDILEKLDEKLNSYKKENDLYDFIDISKLAIKIVKENPGIQEELKNYFLEIMVDEYQDTSDLQEEFINLISNHNLYMVGDIKQSIYRFRNANPNIFQNKYQKYSQNDDGMKIDLLKCFRSREEVISNINLVFNFVMSEDFGGADYVHTHQMVFGNQVYNNEGKTNQNQDFLIYHYNYDRDNKFSKEEIEAFIIASDIEDKINNHYQVYDKKTKKLRDITYDDFCILIDRGSSFELFKKVFVYKHIPLSIRKDEYLTNSSLFLVIKSIYALLINVKEQGNIKEKAFYFLSIGRSFLYNYRDEYLFDVVTNNLYEETEIFKIIKEILVNIEDKTISQILDEIIKAFNFYEKIKTLGSVKDNNTKIEYLYTLAETLNKMGYTYQDFNLFIDELFDDEDEIRFPINEDNVGSVKIMTIHKSKGLEFGLCYFPGLYKEFNMKDASDRFNYQENLGIITPYYDEGIANTLLYELYKKNYYHDEISEKIRLFYVALTRAKEKMILLLPEKDTLEEYEKTGLVDKSIQNKYRSFADILYSISSKIKKYYAEINLNKLSLTKDYNIVNNSNLFLNLRKTGDKINVLEVPKIIKKEMENKHFSKSSIKLVDKEEKEVMEFGSKIHYYLETLDLLNPSFDNIEEKYVLKIKKFLESDLVKDLDKAKIYQEYEFMDEEDNINYQGIIDLMLEYSDHIDIIDYKLKNIDDVAYQDQLKGYQKYIEKIKKKKVSTYLYSIMDEKYKKLN